MRECLRRLFVSLLVEEEKEKVIEKYVRMRKDIYEDSIELDYDEIN